jgi:pentatricopeptide repeat protein
MYLKKETMFKNKLVESDVRLMFYGISIINTYAKSRMVINDVCRVFDKMHAHTM